MARQLCETRARAQRAISDGFVMVNGAIATKPALKVSTEDSITIDDRSAAWVSRAALKLEPFLTIEDGAIALDLGASTGGFTQLLLMRGACKVFAVDVGHDQLHPSLRDDPRIRHLEGVNVKDLDAGSYDDPDWPKFDVITADLSFISLQKALPAALDLSRAGATIYALIKPQFELDPSKIGKGGLVKHDADALGAVEAICAWIDQMGWRVETTQKAPITGGDGNQEYIMKAIKR